MTRNWKRKLARTLVVVGDGDRVLTTLNEAGLFLIERVHAEGEAPALTATITLLMQAAETGDPQDVMAATDATEVVLRTSRLH